MLANVIKICDKHRQNVTFMYKTWEMYFFMKNKYNVLCFLFLDFVVLFCLCGQDYTKYKKNIMVLTTP